MWGRSGRLRAELREHVLAQIDSLVPKVVVAYGIGAIIAYDALSHLPGRRELILVTAGSQLGNVFVRQFFAGRLDPPAITSWFDLHNRFDETLTAPTRLLGPTFQTIDTPFQASGSIEEDALGYLTHSATRDDVWRVIAGGRLTGTLARVEKAFRFESRAAPERRALLIGVGEHEHAESRVPGTTNDVFLVSSALQESGFHAEDIAVLLDERATAGTIRDALRWLLEATRPEDERVLYYSGRGAYLPRSNRHGRS